MLGSSGVQSVVQLSQTPGQGTRNIFSCEGTNSWSRWERLPGTAQDRPQSPEILPGRQWILDLALGDV